MNASPAISVVVPSFNPDPELLRRLYASLLAQTRADFEVIIVDDASTRADYAQLDDPRFRVLRLKANGGPAAARNRGVADARSARLFFTDTDCELAPDCLAQAAAALDDDKIVMGDTRTRVETAFGKAVALLGFPGGGCLGFDRVWRVDEAGYTRSFSSCNLAFDKALFESLGKFNETFPVAGGEDTVLARHAVDSGYRIRYAAQQRVYHVERADLAGFLRWQITRGRGNYYIKQHVPEVGGYLRLRLWTYANSIRAAGVLYAIPVTVLWVLSVVYQTIGFQREARREDA